MGSEVACPHASVGPPPEGDCVCRQAKVRVDMVSIGLERNACEILNTQSLLSGKAM